MRAVRVSPANRALLLDPDKPLTRLRLLRAAYLIRWAGRLPEGGVLTPTGLVGGACGHHSLFRWRILLHRHRGGRPVPEDMKAALRGEAPVPEWFLKGRPGGGAA